MSAIEPIKVPKWGLSMEEGTIVEWHVAIGDKVAEGDDLVDIETTKITNVCEAHMDGVIRRIVAQPGQTLPVGGLIAVMAGDEASDADIDAFIAEYEEHFDPAEAAGEAGLEIEKVEISGGRSMRVGIAGKANTGVPFVLLHGFGGDLENWSLIQEALASDYQVYAVELPGHGQSTKDVGGGQLEDLATAVLEAAEALDLSSFIVVGHSLGGAVATYIAAHHADQVQGLGLLCPAAMPGGTLSTDYLNGFVSAKRSRDLRKNVEKLFHDPAMVTRDMLDGLIKMKRLDGAEAALASIKDNLIGGDPAYAGLGATLAKISAPITVIAGKADQIVGTPDFTQFPEGADAQLLDDIGHMPHLERADDVVGALLNLAGRTA